MTGHVWDGRGLSDHDYSSDNRTVSAWWRGFSDDESYIDHYDWCVGTAPGKQDVVTCRDVGLHTRSTAELSSTKSSGVTSISWLIHFWDYLWFIFKLRQKCMSFIVISNQVAESEC